MQWVDDIFPRTGVRFGFHTFSSRERLSLLLSFYPFAARDLKRGGFGMRNTEESRSGSAIDPSAGQKQIVASLQEISRQLDELKQELREKTKEVYTTEEVAEMTGRAEYTVRTWIRKGLINATRVAGSGPRGRLLIARGELNKLLSNGKGAALSAISCDE